MAEQVDARDLKSLGQQSCGFESRRPHKIEKQGDFRKPGIPRLYSCYDGCYSGLFPPRSSGFPNSRTGPPENETAAPRVQSRNGGILKAQDRAVPDQIKRKETGSASVAVIDRRGFLLALVSGPAAARTFLREVRHG